jgi:PAS domain S-box-containing protein
MSKDSAEEKELLELSELRYRRLFETAQDGVLLVDFDTGKIFDANPFLEKLLGYSKADFLEKYLWEIGVFKNVAASKDDFLELKTKGYIRYEDLPLETKDGKKIAVEFVSNSYDVGGTKVIQCNVRDITDRKRTEKELDVLIRRQQSVLSAIPDIIMEVDNDKIYTWANKAGYAFFGDDVIGKEASSYFKGDQKTYELARPVFEGSGTPVYLESWQRRKDGQKRLLAWYCVSLKDKDGKVTGALSSAHDITEHKRAEDASRDSEEKYRRAFDTSPDAVNINRLEDGLYVDVNKGFAQLMGFTREDAIGKTSVELGIWHNPADRQELVKRLKEKGHYENLEAQFRRKDGSLVTGLMSAGVISLNGVPHIISITRDITERKEWEGAIKRSEEKYRSLFEGAVDAIVIIDSKGVIEEVNPSSFEFLHYSKEEVVGKNLADLSLVTTKGKLTILKNFAERMLGKEIPPYEIDFITKEGKVAPAEINVSVRREGGKIVGVVAFIRSVAERKKALEELENKNKDLEHFNRFAVDRELKMVELKNKINELEEELKRKGAGK